MLTSTKSANTILAVDDDLDVLATIERVLSREGHSVIEADTAATALRLAQEHRPDVIILDVTLTDTTGFELCSQLRTLPFVDQTPILFLSVHQSPQYVAKALDCGGDDYLRKPFATRELKARVRALLRRSTKRVVNHVPHLDLYAGNFSVAVDNRRVVLTPTEFLLLEFLCRDQSTYHTSGALLEGVWQYPEGDGDTALVRNHIRNLRCKLEQDPAHPKIVVSLHGRGYTVQANVSYHP